MTGERAGIDRLLLYRAYARQSKPVSDNLRDGRARPSTLYFGRRSLEMILRRTNDVHEITHLLVWKSFKRKGRKGSRRRRARRRNTFASSAFKVLLFLPYEIFRGVLLKVKLRGRECRIIYVGRRPGRSADTLESHRTGRPGPKWSPFSSPRFS